MLIWCMNKNPSNKLDQNTQNHQKPKISLVQKFEKFWWKCMYACNSIKKEGKSDLLGVKEENPWNFDS